MPRARTDTARPNVAQHPGTFRGGCTLARGVALKRAQRLPIWFVMSEKRTTHPEQTLKALAAAVPWWVWVGAAIASHALLRLAADPDTTSSAHFGDSAAWGGQAFWVSFAGVAQYLVPALCIVGAVLCPRQRRTAGTAPERVADAHAAPEIGTLRWREFEALVGQAFVLQGYHLNEVGAAGSDASIDLLMRKERQTYLVHCKQWRALKVEVETLRAVQAAMQACGAAGGFVLAAGRFSREASAFASGVNIRLVDGPALQALLQQAHAARPEPAASAAVKHDPAPAPSPQPVAKAAPTPADARAPVPRTSASAELALPCPVCGADMLKRLAKRGVHAGQYFWGCSQHPACKGTRRSRPG